MNHETLVRMLASLTTDELESLSGTVYSMLDQRAIDDAPKYSAPTPEELNLFLFFTGSSLRESFTAYRDRTGQADMCLRQVRGIFRYAKIKHETEKVLIIAKLQASDY